MSLGIRGDHLPGLALAPVQKVIRAVIWIKKINYVSSSRSPAHGSVRWIISTMVSGLVASMPLVSNRLLDLRCEGVEVLGWLLE